MPLTAEESLELYGEVITYDGQVLDPTKVVRQSLKAQATAPEGFKGTPGPWRADKTNALGAYGVWTDYAHPNNPNAGYPAQVCGHDIHCHVITQDERNANARLIAAAPELLAALIKVVAIADRKTVEFDQARAAISKAQTGEHNDLDAAIDKIRLNTQSGS